MISSYGDWQTGETLVQWDKARQRNLQVQSYYLSVHAYMHAQVHTTMYACAKAKEEH